MRDHDEEDPKKPHPVTARRKRENAFESQEHEPREVSPDRKRGDLDRHMHV